VARSRSLTTVGIFARSFRRHFPRSSETFSAETGVSNVTARKNRWCAGFSRARILTIEAVLAIRIRPHFRIRNRDLEGYLESPSLRGGDAWPAA
jgi:hypothetical protein